MEYIFLSKQIVGFSNTTQIVGFSNGDDSEDLFLTKTLTNMKYPPNVIKNWYPRLTLRTNLCTKNMINSFQWWCCVCLCVINEKGVPVSQHIVCPVQFIYPVLLSLNDGNLWKPDICSCFMADVMSTCLYQRCHEHLTNGIYSIILQQDTNGNNMVTSLH